ncbi:unnamed protein product [Pylaiella littoralis]
MSFVTYLPLLSLLLAANAAVGFIAPSLHASTGVPTTYSSLQRPIPVTRCREVAATYDAELRGRGVRRSSRLSMEVEPHVLRLQAAELGSKLRGTNVFFVGMMGTGKSTVARALADVMGRYIPLDTDSIIEELLVASCDEIFATDGEEAFRSVESQVLDQVHSYVKVCVATGGGMVTEPKNWGRLQTGMVVWLHMEPEHIFERLSRDPEQVAKRPLLSGDDPLGKLEEITETRKSLYEMADVTVQIAPEDGVDDVTYNVVNTVLEFIDSNPPKWQKWKEKANQAGIEWA